MFRDMYFLLQFLFRKTSWKVSSMDGQFQFDFLFLSYFGFIRCKSEQPLLDMVLHEKEEEKDEKYIGKLFRKSLVIKETY